LREFVIPGVKSRIESTAAHKGKRHMSIGGISDAITNRILNVMAPSPGRDVGDAECDFSTSAPDPTPTTRGPFADPVSVCL
jgi:hypothetical protein